ncbi:MAG: hypothetical protein AAFN81_27570 [Bacteroidota bacterium]
MQNHHPYRTIFSIILPIGLLLLLTFLLPWQSITGSLRNKAVLEQENQTAERQDSTLIKKHKGAHIFSVEDTIDLELLRAYNLEWATMVSWAFQDDYDSPHLGHHSGDSLKMAAYDSSWVKRIQIARSAGYKVFFKPHLWIHEASEGKWRSDIFPASETDWEQWQAEYRSFIIRYAKVAERAGAELYCIGTEFTRLTTEKPEFWEALIQEVRGVYSGQITYAANWYGEFDKITFWDQLDYVGVQAYFPLAKTPSPSVEEISQGWEKHIRTMEAVQQRYDKKILFTELGYRSISRAAIKPWEWVENATDQDSLYSVETQARCYQAFFNTIWEKDWFAGVHIWQLRSDFAERQEQFRLDFTPQGKPAGLVIAEAFAQ